MKKYLFKSSRLLMIVLVVSALAFSGCGSKKSGSEEKTPPKGAKQAATFVDENGSTVSAEDIIKNNKDENEDKDSKDSKSNKSKASNSSNGDGENIGNLVDSGSNNKSDSKKSSSKSNNKKSNKSSKKNSNSSKKDSGSKKSSDKKSNSKKSNKKGNFDIEENDDDNRFGPIIDG